MWRKRAKLFMSMIMILFGCLIIRLAQIQLISTEGFSKQNINLLEASVKQRSQEVVIDSGRGSFLDRNGKMIVHEKMRVLILFPFLKKMDWDVNKVAGIIGQSAPSISAALDKADEPFAFGNPNPVLLTEEQMRQINSLEIPGVFAVEKKYQKIHYPAEQLIGITGENKKLLRSRYPDKRISGQTSVGLTGLEKSFDEFLLAEGAAKLVYHVDGIGGPLFGIHVKYVEPANPFYPVNVKTTLDLDYQELAEELADNHGIKDGGLLLLDIETNSVLASVSRPLINRDAPFEPESSGIKNMMTTEHIPGSVFKTVVAAAAIDHQLDDPSRLFDCSKTINGEPDQKYQHGLLNFSDSFARSCNNTFGTLANELREIDEDILDDYARKLSLTGKNGWYGNVFHVEGFQQLPDEDFGRTFLKEDEKRDKNYTAMTGIGQHEVRVTPLAVANMIATIAKGGKKEMVRVASSVVYKNGTSIVSFEKKKHHEESISPYTAMKLQKLLREVVVNEEGTGRWFRELPYEIAGKSGTAETGKFTEDGQQLHNKWFAGYFPYDNPKYALVTVNLSVKDSEGEVNMFFADMVKGIYELEQERNNKRS